MMGFNTRTKFYIFTGPPKNHLPGNIIYATVALVYNNTQFDHDLSSSTRFGEFQKFEKN